MQPLLCSVCAVAKLGSWKPGKLEAWKAWKGMFFKATSFNRRSLKRYKKNTIMASRAQQVYAGQRKFGHAMSIVSVLQGNEKGTKEYQQWKEQEAKASSQGTEQMAQELLQVKKQRCRIMATIFRYQQGRLTLRRILDMYPIAWTRCAEFYQRILHTKIEKKVLQIKIHLVVIQVQRRWRRKKILQHFLNDVSSNKIRRWWRVWHQLRFRRLYKEGTRINHWLRHIYTTYEAKNVIAESQKKKKSHDSWQKCYLRIMLFYKR